MLCPGCGTPPRTSPGAITCRRRRLGRDDEATPLIRGAVAVLTEVGAHRWLASVGTRPVHGAAAEARSTQ